MNVSLTPELEKLVSEKVSSGMYQTGSEVIREALRLLRERDERKREELRRMIQVGVDQLERGEYTEYDEHTLKNLAREIKARGRRRLARMRKAGS